MRVATSALLGSLIVTGMTDAKAASVTGSAYTSSRQQATGSAPRSASRTLSSPRWGSHDPSHACSWFRSCTKPHIPDM